ncbi:MAG: hypothetical protein LBG96_05355 [Tannerella sp.]|nr:hypothetical protein [Tannerella sp.]
MEIVLPYITWFFAALLRLLRRLTAGESRQGPVCFCPNTNTPAPIPAGLRRGRTASIFRPVARNGVRS